MSTSIKKRGVLYFKRYKDARAICQKLVATYPQAHIVAYVLGWTVQYRLYGAYYPQYEILNEL